MKASSTCSSQFLALFLALALTALVLVSSWIHSPNFSSFLGSWSWKAKQPTSSLDIEIDRASTYEGETPSSSAFPLQTFVPYDSHVSNKLFSFINLFPLTNNYSVLSLIFILGGGYFIL